MKRVFLFLVISGLATIAASGQKKETRMVLDFTGINASSVFNITVEKGSTESLVIEADDNVMPYVRSEVQNGVLYLYLDNSTGLRNIKTLKASIVMKNLDRVTLSGACRLTTNGFFTPEKFKADCSGASDMALNLNTNQLNLEASGACKIQIEANITGNADWDLSGAAKISGGLKAENVKFNLSGVCFVELSGSANDLEIYVSGASKIMAENFVVKTATIKSSGAGKITVNVTDVLKVNSSGASSVNYKGSPSIELNKNQASKVRKI